MYTVTEIAESISAERIGTHEEEILYLLTDSRSLTFPENSLFFAIKTQRNDGHKYIDTLYNRGVRAFVVEQIPENYLQEYPEAVFLKVADTVSALQNLAKTHRQKYDIPVIGITGSNGKTTVKEWMYHLLYEDRYITRSPRSYNSQIGVPLSVWMLNAQSETALFEAGISKKGEMERLEEIIRPTIAVFTNLGTAHQENFSSEEEKAAEKVLLFRHSRYAIYSLDNCIIAKSIRESEFNGEHITWSTKDRNARLFIESISYSTCSLSATVKYTFRTSEGTTIQSEYSLLDSNKASVENSITCLACCLLMKMKPEVFAKRIATITPVAMRLEVKEGLNSCTLINDTYNNDLHSLDIALDYMARRPESRKKSKTLITSDIMQSGLSLPTLANELSTLVSSRNVSHLIFIGTELKEELQKAICQKGITIRAEYFDSTEDFLSSESLKALANEVILIKGARAFRFERITERMEQKVHETVLEINLSALVENYNHYRSMMSPETKLVCMVKANAYGAGAIEVSKILQENHVDYLAVAVVDEGVTLREAGVTCNIMVMNPEMSSFKTMFDNNLEPEIYSFHLLESLILAARHEGITNYPVHIKLDTGMGRLGFDPLHDMDRLIDVLKSQKALIPRSVFSHLAGADEDRLDNFSLRQHELFMEGSRKLQEAFSHKILRHLCNSAGIEHFPQWHMEMCRLGLGLYGINPRDNKPLNTVATLKTTILQIHSFSAGTSIGYSRKTILDRESRIAVIPIGYADGLNRMLGNRAAYCLVNGQKAQYVGNICMDVAMIDVTDISCNEGDTVEIFGKNLPVTTLSDTTLTIPYEILTGVSLRVKRVYYTE